MAWILQAAPNDEYTVQPGGTYRLTVSVDKSISTQKIADILAPKGWTLLNFWEASEKVPADWPKEAPIELRNADHRVLRGQGLFQGEPNTTIGVDPPFFLTVYRILQVWRYSEGGGPTPGPIPAPPVPPGPPRATPPLGGVPWLTIALLFVAWRWLR